MIVPVKIPFGQLILATFIGEQKFDQENVRVKDVWRVPTNHHTDLKTWNTKLHAFSEPRFDYFFVDQTISIAEIEPNWKNNQSRVNNWFNCSHVYWIN